MRYIENWAAVVGMLVVVAYVLLVEIMPHSGLMACSTPPVHPGFPWGVVILVAALVAPKTLGRASAGRIWEIMADRLPGKRPPPDGQ